MCNEIKNKLVEYVYDELDGAERAAVEEHLKACAECRAELDRLRKAHGLLSTLKPVAASEGLGGKITARLPMKELARKPNTILRMFVTVAAAAVVLYVVIAVFSSRSLDVPVIPKAHAEGGEPQVEKVSFIVTVYNDNLGMIKDKSRITNLKEGVNSIRFWGLASGIKPDSVSFKSLTSPRGTQILEQNFEYDFASATAILDKYVDRELTVVTEDGSEHKGRLNCFDSFMMDARLDYATASGQIARRESYERLSRGLEDEDLFDPTGTARMVKYLLRSGNVTLALDDGRLDIIPVRLIKQIKLGQMPPDMVTRPTLAWELDVKRPGEHEVEVGYLTEGMSWDADYVAVVSQDDTAMDFKGWVTIRNTSGATYTDAALKLIAGDVNVIKPLRRQVEYMKRGMVAGAPGKPKEMKDGVGFVEKSFFEYHMYTLQGTTTLKDNEIKQITLFPELKRVPVKKIYVYNGSRFGNKVRTLLEFENIKENNMGIPLPKGKIDHTPAGKKEFVRIFLGNAFDIAGEWKQTGEAKLGPNSREKSFEIRLRNHKETDVDVVVQESHLQGSWTMVKNSHDYEKKNASTVEFKVTVPKGGKETVVSYTVRFDE
jgi:hypothetical protein